ncbi:MAG: MerR family transcriptional regulator [Candidatus Aminicenantes bacterium]|nr:MerR family transcriptional regulator [Candidatus Aminicenantes bacterium]
MKPKTPDKLFYRLEEVSRILKIPAETIAVWEREIPFLQPGLRGDGKKIFRPRDVEIMRRIKALLDEKSVTLAGAKRRVEEEFGLRPSPAVHPEKIVQFLWRVRDDLQDISQSLAKRPKKG